MRKAAAGLLIGLFASLIVLALMIVPIRRMMATAK